MQRKPIFHIALALALLMPVTALAGPGFGPRGERGDGPPMAGRHFFPPPGYLDLTEEQIEATQAIRDNLHDQLEVLREEFSALRQQLRDLLDGDNPDPAAVGELVIELHSERGQFRDLLAAAEAEFEALLTAEQLTKWENFQELREQRRRRGPGGRGPGGHGPGGGFGK